MKPEHEPEAELEPEAHSHKDEDYRKEADKNGTLQVNFKENGEPVYYRRKRRSKFYVST